MSTARCSACAALIEEGARFCGSCGAPVPARSPAPARVLPPTMVADSMLGRVLNHRFRIVGEIGQGGFGTVYEGVQLQMDRPVAIKVLHRRMTSDPQLVERFRREAHAASNLRDAHTIITYDFDQTEDGILYLVVELLKGRSLLQELTQLGKIEPRRAAFLVDQVCSALAEAHSHGIVHRDIKPENIFLEDRESQRDYVKVLDFGIAKILAGEDGATARLTASGQTLGTLEYMSPEQLAGTDLDGRSDIYSLGITFYQMLTGSLPFTGTPTAVIAAHLNLQPDLPSKRNRIVPPAFDAVVMRCLAKQRERRYPDMAALRVDLASLGAVPATANAAAAPLAPKQPRPQHTPEAMATTMAPVAAAADETAEAAVQPRAAAPRPAPGPRKVSGGALALIIVLIVLGALGGIVVATYLYLGDDSRAGSGTVAHGSSKSDPDSGKTRTVSWQQVLPGSSGSGEISGSEKHPVLAGSSSLERLVPSGTAFVLQLEPSRLMAAGGFQQGLSGGLPPQARQFLQGAGIRLEQIREALLIMPSLPKEGGRSLGVLALRGVDGSFLEQVFQRSGSEPRVVEGVKILVRGNDAMARLDDGNLLLGNTSVVQAALQARAAKRGGLASDAAGRTLLGRVRRQGSLAYVLLHPGPEQMDELRQELKLGADMSLRGIAVALSEAEGRWSIDAVVQASSPAAAATLQQKARQALERARSNQQVAQLGLAELLQGVKLSTDESRLQLQLELERAAVSRLLSRLQNELPAGAGRRAIGRPRRRPANRPLGE